MRLLRLGFGMLLLVAIGLPDAGAQLTVNALFRVLMIQTDKNQGTAFTVDVDGRQYLITAKHMVAGLGDEGTVQIRRFTRAGSLEWEPVQMKIFRCGGDVDIAVLVPPEQLTVSFPLEPTKDGMQYGQEAYFVGFPLGMYSQVKTGFPLAYPFGFVKRGVLSGERDDGNAHITFLDGFNIFGFSGSPVVFRDPNQGGAVYKVLGVVSGFKPDYGPVLVPEKIRREDAKPEELARGRIVEKDGQWFRLQEAKSGSEVVLNTGIVVTYGIEHAVEVIRAHPVGPKTSDGFQPVPAD